jgi:hypothetical protein
VPVSAAVRPKQFWRKLAAVPDFFAELDLLPDVMDLYRAARHLDTIILTGLPRGDWAEPQKRRWAERYFPDVPVITTTAALKYEPCYPGDALVDDRDKYRHLWERGGGIFIHIQALAHRLRRFEIMDLALKPAIL